MSAQDLPSDPGRVWRAPGLGICSRPRRRIDGENIEFFDSVRFRAFSEGYGLTGDFTGRGPAASDRDFVGGNLSVFDRGLGYSPVDRMTSRASRAKILVRGPIVMKGSYQEPSAHGRSHRQGTDGSCTGAMSGSLSQKDCSFHLGPTSKLHDRLKKNGKKSVSEEIEVPDQSE
jgi:hypothetical protein